MEALGLNCYLALSGSRISCCLDQEVAATAKWIDSAIVLDCLHSYSQWYSPFCKAFQPNLHFELLQGKVLCH